MKFTKIEILKLASKIIKSLSVAVTGSVVMGEANKFIVLAVVMGGSAADAIISFIKEKENKAEIEKASK